MDWYCIYIEDYIVYIEQSIRSKAIATQWDEYPMLNFQMFSKITVQQMAMQERL